MEVGLALGGSVLSAVLQVAFDRIASSKKLVGLFHGKRKLQLNRLDRLFQAASVVLEDAESKQAKSPAVKRWFNSLRHAVHQTDDLLDEINTERLRVKGQQPEIAFIDTDFIKELMPRLEVICDTLESFVSQIDVLGLKNLDAKEKRSDWRPSTSVVVESQIVGRDDEKDKIVEMVFSDEGSTSISVIPITGMGGVGKTTLAQLVYNDERVKNHFKTRAWVCVSEDYDAHRITESLLMEFKFHVDNKDDFNRLQVKLKDNIQGKLFLVILDDIWNDNYNDWQRLMAPLYSGSPGSKIIVTTRNEKVAMMMQDVPFHSVQPIPTDHSWSLFKSHAFDNRAHISLPEFESIGRNIVKKCKGLPLAIKTVAGALRSKRDISEWHDILSSETWMVESDVLPALSLSYELLPSHLKCCFAFCAVFPKDVPFNKDEVALLWMANDLVQPSTQKLAKYYFEELRSRSLFEIVDGNMYSMHDLVNDLAQYVSGFFTASIGGYQSTDELRRGVQEENNLPPEVLHFSYLSSSYDASKRFRGLAQVQSLRTFLPICKSWHSNDITKLFFLDILPRFRSLRVLSLSGYLISVIPDTIGDLKHLRFLNLAMTLIEKLPNAIGKCLNLQTLILENCSYLVELPKDMKLLINLQLLDVRGVGDIVIDKMKSWLSLLKDIKNLSIVIDKIHGSVLEELDKLQASELLEIIGLETVVKVGSVELKEKEHIKNLSLNWKGMAQRSNDELNILDKLQPHTSIKELSIEGYRGTAFSDWLGDSAFIYMETLYLQDCKNCFSLPPLGQLSALKKLHISGLSKITVVGEEFYGNSSTSKPFQVLEELSFGDMEEWSIWNTHPDNVDFSSLKELCISDCPKLVGDIRFYLTSLRKVEIKGMSNLQVANISNLLSLKKTFEANHLVPDHVDTLGIEHCPSFSLSGQAIKKLVIERCKHVEFLTSVSCNSGLESLTIQSCGDSIEAISLFSFNKLRKLEIFGCNNPNLFKFPNGYNQTFTPLQSLTITGCNNILCFPEGGLNTPNLKNLFIWGCKNLKSLPVQMHTQLSLLEDLYIARCHYVECFPEGGLPSSLEKLSIRNCKKLMSCQTSWGLQRLQSLRQLSIHVVDDKLFLEEGLFPSGLQDLIIGNWQILEALNNKSFQHLSSLQSLSISLCPNLRSLPENGLPSPLLELRIYDCAKLKARMEREKGEDWPKVSHIPLIYIDNELVS